MSTPAVKNGNGNGGKLLAMLGKNPLQLLIVLLVLAMLGVNVGDVLGIGGGGGGKLDGRVVTLEREGAVRGECLRRLESDMAELKVGQKELDRKLDALRDEIRRSGG